MKLHIDFESRSRVDLKTRGLGVYCEDPSTDFTIMAYAFDDGPIEVIHSCIDTTLPKDVSDFVMAGGVVCAHNANFEWNIWNKICVPRYGWPALSSSQLDCTMARCFSMGIPGSLEKAAIALNLNFKKDMQGSRAMMAFAEIDPRTNDFRHPHDFIEKYEKMVEYCKMDIEVERELDKRLFNLTPEEKKIWLLDQEINTRGLPIDVRAVTVAQAIAENEKTKLDLKMREVTKNAVATCNAVAQITYFLTDHGVALEGVAKNDILDALKEEALPPICREVLNLRKEAAKSSTAKLSSMLNRVSLDGRIRNTLQYHGAATGRWSGRGIQIQNFPRGEHTQEEIETFFDIISNGLDVGDFFTSPLSIISSSLRGFITPKENHTFLGADFSSIEARVLAWAAGEEHVLEVFRENGDLYKAAASAIYHKPIEEISKSERQIGKVACIAEGEQVLTDAGLIPIEKVTINQKVWDGEDWVSHDGVVYKGEREVIEYEGLKATEDHKVFTQFGELPFGVCARKQIKITQTGIGGKEIRLGRDYICESNLEIQNGQARAQSACQVFNSALHRVFRSKRNKLRQLVGRKNERLPSLLAAKTNSKMARPAINFCQEQVYKPERSKLEKLWSKGYRVSVFFGFIRRIMDKGKLRAGKGERDRQDKQQRALRSGKSPVGYEANASLEHSAIESDNRPSSLGGAILTVFNVYYSKIFSRRTISKRNYTNRDASGKDEAKELARHTNQTHTVRVYDIINCGPNQRFTVSNLLVHNCLALGYGGGIGAFKSMAKAYGVEVSDKEADAIKTKWRKAHPNITSYWYELEQMAQLAIKNKGETYKAGCEGREVSYLVSGSFLWCKLPSGRVLCYPYPKIEMLLMPWGEEKEGITYMSEAPPSNKWGRVKTYGGSLSENISQALARDVLACSMLRLAKEKYSIIATIHDEILCEEPTTQVESGVKSIEKLEELLSIAPDWAKDLPLSAEGWAGPRYKK